MEDDAAEMKENASPVNENMEEDANSYLVFACNIFYSKFLTSWDCFWLGKINNTNQDAVVSSKLFIFGWIFLNNM